MTAPWPDPPQIPGPPRIRPAPDMVAAMLSPLRWHAIPDELPAAPGVLDQIVPVTPETTGSEDDPVAWALHTLGQLTPEQRAEVFAYYRNEVPA